MNAARKYSRPLRAFVDLVALATVCCAVLSCAGSNRVPENVAVGTWTGTLTPMNHPDQTTPIFFDVGYTSGEVSLVVFGEDGGRIAARDVTLARDGLYFTFNEPEAGIPLRCGLLRNERGYSGRCSDSSGKWAQFDMKPPQ